MSSNGLTSPRNSTSDSRSPRESLSSVVSPPSSADVRLSLDSGRSSPSVNGPNGTLNGRRHDDDNDEDGGQDPVQKLQRDLQRTNEEKENLATQYQNLLTKLTAMRTTLGNKVKQDAVRRQTQQKFRQPNTEACIGRTRPTRTANTTANSSKR